MAIFDVGVDAIDATCHRCRGGGRTAIAPVSAALCCWRVLNNKHCVCVRVCVRVQALRFCHTTVLCGTRLVQLTAGWACSWSVRLLTCAVVHGMEEREVFCCLGLTAN